MRIELTRDRDRRLHVTVDGRAPLVVAIDVHTWVTDLERTLEP